MTQSTSVLDISHWQDSVDFPALKQAGILGIILKATEGLSYVDSTFVTRKTAAHRAGLITSQYHFLKHGKADQQMVFFFGTTMPVPGERMVIDYEDAACTLQDLHEACKALLMLDPSLQVTIYGANGFLGAQLGGKRDEYLANFSLWVASYTTKPDPTMTNLAATWPSWTLWQYTDKATIAGAGPYDGNRFNGSDAACASWLAPAGSVTPPVPEPKPTYPSITLNIESDQPVTLKITGGANVTVYS